MRPVIPYVTAALLFGLGVYGVLRRRNAVLLLMAVELMLNAVNLILVTADVSLRSALQGVTVESWARPGAAMPGTGGVLALFVIVLAAGYYYTWRVSQNTLAEMRAQRTAMGRPLVILQEDYDDLPELDVTLRNVSAGAARDISFEF